MRRPNIVLVMLDAVRASNLLPYGYGKSTSPFLDRFSEENTLYPDAVSSSYWTMPSLASWFTGTYVSRHKLVVDGETLSRDFTTLAEFLRLQGYEAASFTATPYAESYSGLDRGFENFSFSHLHRLVNVAYISGLPISRKINERAVEYVRDKTSKGVPFFIFLFYPETHFPFVLPLSYHIKFKINPLLYWRMFSLTRERINILTGETSLTYKDQRMLEEFYDACIYAVDSEIKNLHDFLGENGLLDNTMFIVSSDHGDNFGEQGLFSHRFCLYDSLIKIPLMIKYPKGIKAQSGADSIAQNVDLFPTILDLLGLQDDEVINQVEGNSLISDKIRKRNPRYAISELLKVFAPDLKNVKDKLKKFNRRLISCRTVSKKYIWASDGKDEYYDLRRDPKEQSNLVNIEDPEKTKLKKVIDPWIERLEQAYKEKADIIEKGIKISEKAKFDKSVRNRLKSLGYLE